MTETMHKRLNRNHAQNVVICNVETHKKNGAICPAGRIIIWKRLVRKNVAVTANTALQTSKLSSETGLIEHR